MAHATKIKSPKPAVHVRCNQVDSETVQTQTAGEPETSRRLMHGGLILLAVLGMVAVLWTTAPYGIGATSDSVQYIACAHNLIEGQGFKNFDGAPFVSWPPLLPLLLAIPAKLGFDLLSACRYLHALFFGLAIYFAGFLCWQTLHRIWSAFMGGALVLTSEAMLRPCLLVWSEPLFNLLVILFLLFLTRYLENGKLREVILLSMFAALACLQRYVGAMLIVIAFWCIILLQCGRPLRKRLAVGIASCGAAALPAALWYIRNYIETKTLSGGRGKSRFGLGQNIDQMLDTITGWFCPWDMELNTRLLVLLTLGIVLFSVYQLFRPDRSRSAGRTHPGIFICVFFVSTYLTAILLLANIFAFDAITDRLLSPVFVPLLLLVFAGIDKVLKACGGSYKMLCCGAVSALIVWIIIVPASNSWSLISDKRLEGSSYTNKDWSTSPLIAWLKANPLRGVVYCNVPDAVYLHVGIITRFSPGHSSDLASFKKQIIESADVYLVWSRNTDRAYLYNPHELLTAGFKMSLVEEFEDGIVLRFSNR